MEVEEEEEKTQAPDFWNDPKAAETLLKQIQEKKHWTIKYREAETAVNDAVVLAEFFEQDESVHEELDVQFDLAVKKIEDLEFLQMLGREEDKLNAILKINPGAGGTESQDWAEMLMRMYIRYGERKNFKVMWPELSLFPWNLKANLPLVF